MSSLDRGYDTFAEDIVAPVIPFLHEPDQREKEVGIRVCREILELVLSDIGFGLGS